MTSSAEAAHDAEVPGVPDSDKADVIHDRYVDAQAAKQTIFNDSIDCWCFWCLSCSQVYLGAVKSYNDRRGFGFVACAWTAPYRASSQD